MINESVKECLEMANNIILEYEQEQKEIMERINAHIKGTKKIQPNIRYVELTLHYTHLEYARIESLRMLEEFKTKMIGYGCEI